MSIADKLTTIAENQQRVYDAGIEEGKQAEHDAFWDVFQNYGKRTLYRYCFETSAITEFNPKYPITPTQITSLFDGCRKLETVNWSKFDLSKVTSAYCAFQDCQSLKSIDIDITPIGTTTTAFYTTFRWCYALERIQKITAIPSIPFTGTFIECNSLTHVIFDGTIGQSGLDLQWSTKLDRESIESIINALSTTTSGLSITLSKTAVDNAFYNADGEDVIGSEDLVWRMLIAEKPNWTINLV